MGIATLPTASGSSSPLPYGATALVASGTASLGLYQTTSLAAGTYAVVVSAYPNKSSYSYSGTAVATSGVSVATPNTTIVNSLVNKSYAINSSPAYISLGTSDTLTVGQLYFSVNNNAIITTNGGNIQQIVTGTTGSFTVITTSNTTGGYFSSDGITWTGYTQLSTTNGSYFNGYSSNGVYLQGQQPTGSTSPFIGYSTNGTTWTTQASNLPATSFGIYGFAYNGSTFIAVSNHPATANITGSTNGVTWTTRAFVGGGAGQPQAVVWGSSGNYVLVGTYGLINQSTDGLTWSTRTSPTANNLGYLAYNTSNGYYFASSSITASSNIYSTNGTTWTLSSYPIQINSVTSGGNYFYGVNTYGNVVVSTDGNNWAIIAKNSGVGPTGTAAAMSGLATNGLAYHPTFGLIGGTPSGGTNYLSVLPALYVNIYSVSSTPTLN